MCKTVSKEIIQKYLIRAKKSLGQNFLVDENMLSAMLQNIDIFGKNIIEVGPGYGALTEKILEKKPKGLTLIELDTNMVDIINDRIQSGDLRTSDVDFAIHHIDVLKYTPTYKNYLVLANIPYYITSPIIRHFLYNFENKPSSMLILMQKEVGKKILEGQNFTFDTSGEKIEKQYKKLKTSFFSLFIQKKSFVREGVLVGKASFFPSPKVDSIVLYFEAHNLYDELDDYIFLDFIQLAFCEPRKKLSKNLSKKYEKSKIIQIFSRYNIEENIRPEKIDIGLYCKLIPDFHKVLT